MTAFENLLIENKIEYLKDEPMSRHTSFRIGGNAQYFVLPMDDSQLSFVIDYCRKNEIPFTVIGKGSNLLVSDKGIEGAVICTLNMDTLTLLDNERIFAGAGVGLASLCTFARDNELSGLEFAYGIPGSVGGAMIMNAGAYGGEIKDVAVSACVLDENLTVRVIEGEAMELSYRSSVFKKRNLTVIGAYFKLKKDSREEITARMEDYMGRRLSKQPLEYPSGGSVFKRPEGHFAGALVEQNGFKGVSIGGAQVSEKHAGFIINKGNATCSDVTGLIAKIQDTVYKNNGVRLEPELIFKGRE
ncbi:MAG: UDP-N-acetylmuramate dehydrogenase [Acutalibacteraceae bacterium]|nr:UDP-N-acetylmuramate dehydrogenase [Acutalibacteraceae bacterium]